MRDTNRTIPNRYVALQKNAPNNLWYVKRTFGGGSKCQFEPTQKNLNSNIVHQPSQPYGSNSQFEKGRRAPEFEPLMGKAGIEVENRMVDDKNKKIQKNKTTAKENSEPVKKYSNHIEFIDYIPTHEVITYRHLFAYGFYVE